MCRRRLGRQVNPLAQVVKCGVGVNSPPLCPPSVRPASDSGVAERTPGGEMGLHRDFAALFQESLYRRVVVVKHGHSLARIRLRTHARALEGATVCPPSYSASDPVAAGTCSSPRKNRSVGPGSLMPALSRSKLPSRSQAFIARMV